MTESQKKRLIEISRHLAELLREVCSDGAAPKQLDKMEKKSGRRRPPDPTDPLLSTREAADLCGLSPRTLQARRVAGDGPDLVVISPTCVRYRKSAIERWLADRERSGE